MTLKLFCMWLPSPPDVADLKEELIFLFHLNLHLNHHRWPVAPVWDSAGLQHIHFLVVK